MRYRTPLYNVRGLGSAKDGTRHWWLQRVTAAALIPLTLWLAYSLAHVANMDYESARTWLSSPVSAVLMLAALWALLLHAKLGLQVVIEDYLHAEGGKVVMLLLMKFVVILLGLSAAFAVLRIALTG